MALATVSDYWAPDIWIKGVREAFNTFPSIWNSSAVAKSPTFDAKASGGGITVNVPFFADISDQDDEIQAEDTAPATQGHGSGTQIGVMLNRVTKNGVSALSAAISGEDPVADITGQMGIRRQKQHQKSALSILDGAFTTALSALSEDNFLETTVGQGADHLIDGDMIIDGVAVLGEIADQVQNGVICMHSQIRAALLKQDATAFDKESKGAFSITTYKGMQVIVSDALVRAGTTSGVVYNTYVLKPRFFAYGAKPQVPDTGETVDVATIQWHADKDKNNSYVWDRNRILIHPNGMAYTGTPADADAGPTNAELAVGASWGLVYSSADRVGGVRIRTNG